MEPRTERVPTRRVLRGDDGAPLDGDCVLAIASRWQDTPLGLQHVKPGAVPQGFEGLDVRWEGGLPVIATGPHLKAFVVKPGAQPVESGRLTALELGDVFLATAGELTIEARLQRRSERSPTVRRQEGFFFALVLAHSLMAMTALLAALVLVPVTTEETMWGAPSSLRIPVTPTTVIHKQKAPELQEGVEAVVTRGAAKPSFTTPTKQTTAADAMKLLFGGGGGGGIVMAASVGAIDAALNNLTASGPSDSVGFADVFGRDTGAGLGPGVGLNIGKVGTTRGSGDGPSVGLGGKKMTDIVCPGCTPTMGPGYDRALVLKVVRRHQSEIRYCYESELAKDPTLGGKVTVAWTIGATGSVEFAEVAESALGNANVEACIVQRIRRWNFPEPNGGQEVAITFPWVFHVAGADE